MGRTLREEVNYRPHFKPIFLACHMKGCGKSLPKMSEFQRTTKRKPHRTLLGLQPVVTQPFQWITMDMIGHLPVTEEGHCFMLTVCDYGTRYPDAFPLKTIMSTDMAEALIDMFTRVVIPEVILTNSGTNIYSDLLSEFYRFFGIRPIQTLAYHPETDGIVERYNSTLKSGLQKFIDRFGGQWHRSLPCLLFAFRELPHETTGFTPFELA